MDSSSSAMTKEKQASKKVQPPKVRAARHRNHGFAMAFWRAQRGLSQQQLADILGKSQQYISDLERGDTIKPEVIEEVAKALDIEPQDITDWMTDSSLNVFNIDKLGEGEGSTNMVGTYNFETNHEVHIHPIDKVSELYERMLNAKEQQVINLDQTLKANVEIHSQLLEQLKSKDEIINTMNRTLEKNMEMQSKLMLLIENFKPKEE